MGIFNHPKNEGNEPLVACDNCKQLFPKSKLRQCRKCGAVLCSKCQKSHICQAQTTPKEEPEKIVKNTPIEETQKVVKEPQETIAESPRTIPTKPINNDNAVSVSEMQVKPDDNIHQNRSEDDLEKVIGELSEELKPKLIEKLHGVSEDDFDDRLHDIIDNEFDTIISDKISDYLSIQSSCNGFCENYISDYMCQQYCDKYDSEYEIDPCDEWELTEKAKEIIEDKLHDEIFDKVVQDSGAENEDYINGCGNYNPLGSAFIISLVNPISPTVFHIDGFNGKVYDDFVDLMVKLTCMIGQIVATEGYNSALKVTNLLINKNPVDTGTIMGLLRYKAWLTAECLNDKREAIEAYKEYFIFVRFCLDVIPLVSNKNESENNISNIKQCVEKLNSIFTSKNIPLPTIFLSKKIDFDIDIKIKLKDDANDIIRKLLIILGFAGNGDRYSQELLALCYFGGYGFDRDLQKGLYWLEKSYNSGTGNHYDPAFVDGLGLMGKNYEVGITVEQDISKALSWYKKGVENNSPLSMYFLANLYYEGMLVQKNEDKAFTLYEKAAELGSEDARKILEKTPVSLNLKQDSNNPVTNESINANVDSIMHSGGDAYKEKVMAIFNQSEAISDIMDNGDASGALALTNKLLDENPPDSLLKILLLADKAYLTAYLGDQENAKLLLRDALTLKIFVDDIPDYSKNTMEYEIFETADESIEIAKHFFKSLNIPIPTTVFSKKVDLKISIDVTMSGDLNTIIHNLYLVLSLAENGDLDSQVNLAYCYFGGYGVDKDAQKGAYWFEKFSHSDLDGQTLENLEIIMMVMGKNYEVGATVEKDIHKALHWYEKGAEIGSPISMLFLANIYYNGVDIPKDLDKAISLYTKAAELGDSDAENTLGYLYRTGKEVKQDFSKAFYWWTKAAEHEHSGALSNLGELYREGAGVKQDFIRAIGYYRKSADYSNPYGMINLGECYLKGTGVIQDYNEGFNWFVKASETVASAEDPDSLALAQYWIGYCYYNGFGVVKSKIKAREWIEKAIKGNNEEALTFAEEHPDLFSSEKQVYNVSGDFIQDNHGIIAKGEAIVNRAHITKDDSQDAEWETIEESTLSSASQMSDSKISFCPECGKPVDEDAKFCKYCGRKLQ